ncbi:hypothetical protein V492_05396 [Pseudogymnoascus sp. VKM F-4246]|nr:hypothetical protein V492_05396 [Pseudogymnoascus sp. VKM F-4246]
MSQRLATYFVPATGIDREVITTDICRYLGNDALVKPGTHKNAKGEAISGYFITAYRALTTDQLTDIKADSARWGAERAKNQTNRGSQGGGISPLRDSDVGVRSSNITPDVGYRSSLTRARQQQPPWDDAPPIQGGGYSMPSPQQPNPAGRYESYPGPPQQPQQPYGGPQDYNPNPNYTYGAPVGYGLSQPPSQPPRTGFAPPNPQYPGEGRGMNPGYQPDNRPPPQGYYDQQTLIPQGRGQPAIPQQQYQQRDSLPGQDPYNYNNGGRGPQEDQDMGEYGYDDDFADQPPKPTSSGQSRHRSERSDRDADRRTDRHPGKHRR